MPQTSEGTWTATWLTHRGDLVRYTSGLLSGDVQAAEDVVQETALRLWRHPEVLDDDRPLAGWLRTVARNIVVDQRRRRGARPTEVELPPGVGGVHGDPFDQLAACDAVTGVLASLAPRHRVVVFEVYVRGRGIADVAHDLAIPVGTVKSRCHQALRQLRAYPDLVPTDHP